MRWLISESQRFNHVKEYVGVWRDFEYYNVFVLYTCETWEINDLNDERFIMYLVLGTDLNTKVLINQAGQ